LTLKGYIARRAAYTILLVFLIIIFNFFLFQVLPFTTGCPGETFTQCAVSLYIPAPAAGASLNSSAIYQHQRQVVMQEYGFDQPLSTRFVLYVWDMLTWQFGFNIGGSLGGPVVTTLVLRLPYTVMLMGLSTIAAFIIGIGLGVIAAARRGRLADISSLSGSLFFNALPVFWLAGVLLVLQILATGGAYVNVGTATLNKSGIDAAAATMQALVLPFLTVTLVSEGRVFLTMRATMIDTLAEDYVIMARAKGVQERTVLFREAFRNAILPIVTLFALSIGFILAGAIVTETVFNWPGLGSALYAGVVSNDFPLEQALFYMIALMVLLANFAADVLYGFLDPRIKAG
jgi:peptide/nickel transport system permease protein